MGGSAGTRQTALAYLWPGPHDLTYPDTASATPFLSLITASEAGRGDAYKGERAKAAPFADGPAS